MKDNFYIIIVRKNSKSNPGKFNSRIRLYKLWLSSGNGAYTVPIKTPGIKRIQRASPPHKTD